MVRIEEGILKLLDRFSYGLTIEDVSVKLGVSRPTASKYLFGLEKGKRISVRTIGKYRLHYPKGMLKGRGFNGVYVLIALFAASLLLPSVSNAALITVCSSGCDYPSIQNAINNAIAYDEVRITDSLEYNESVVVNVTGITLTSNASPFPAIFSDSPDLGPFNATVNISRITHNVTITKINIKYNGTAPYTQAIASRSTNNVTIQNLTAQTFWGTRDNYGVYFYNVTNSAVDNVTIMTNGTGTNNYGFFLFSSSTRNNISNTTIITNGTTNNYGIYFLSNSNSNTLGRSTVITSGTSNSYGVFIFSATNTVKQNTIFTSGSSASNHGIYIIGSGSTLDQNTISASGSGTSYGILLSAGSSSLITNNTVSTSGAAGNNHAIYALSRSNSNIFRSNNITTGAMSSYGVRIENSGNNTFYDDFINASVAYDVFLASTPSIDKNFFVNVSFNKSDINTTSANTSSSLFVQYRFDATVTDGISPLSGTLVIGNDTNSQQNSENPTSNFSTTTNSTGQIPTQTLTEFLANGTYQPLVSGYLYFTNYTVNASLAGYRNAGAAVNISESLNMTLLLSKIGTLVVDLIDPPSPTSAAQNQTFFVNATVTCRNGSCGNVQSFLRHNSSGNYPNDEISTTFGATPFWLNTSNPLSCNANPIDQDEFCNITWYVNATGAIGSVWSLGSNFSSDDTYVSSNHTSNSTVTIIPCFVFLDTFSSVDFGSLYPRTQNNSAPGNSWMLYNISTNGNMTCNANLYIKGQDLEQGGGSQKIGIGNLTWNTTNPVSTPVTYDYRLLASNVPPSLNVTTYYWLTVPGGITSATYSGNITILANWSG